MGRQVCVLLAVSQLSETTRVLELRVVSIRVLLQEWDGTVPAPTILKPEPLWTGKQVKALCAHQGFSGRLLGSTVGTLQPMLHMPATAQRSALQGVSVKGPSGCVLCGVHRYSAPANYYY